MINASVGTPPISSSPAVPSSAPVAATTTPAAPISSSVPTSTPSYTPKKLGADHKPPIKKIIIGVVAFLLLSVGAVTAFYLSQTNSDIRQQASTGGVYGNLNCQSYTTAAQCPPACTWIPQGSVCVEKLVTPSPSANVTSCQNLPENQCKAAGCEWNPFNTTCSGVPSPSTVPSNPCNLAEPFLDNVPNSHACVHKNGMPAYDCNEGFVPGDKGCESPQGVPTCNSSSNLRGRLYASTDNTYSCLQGGEVVRDCNSGYTFKDGRCTQSVTTSEAPKIACSGNMVCRNGEAGTCENGEWKPSGASCETSGSELKTVSCYKPPSCGIRIVRVEKCDPGEHLTIQTCAQARGQQADDVTCYGLPNCSPVTRDKTCAAGEMTSQDACLTALQSSNNTPTTTQPSATPAQSSNTVQTGAVAVNTPTAALTVNNCYAPPFCTVNQPKLTCLQGEYSSPQDCLAGMTTQVVQAPPEATAQTGTLFGAILTGGQ